MLERWWWGACGGGEGGHPPGARRGQWSVAVSRNWRITFDTAGGLVSHLDLEDYH